MAISFMDGNEALARGAVAAGCTFFAGYPITPATTIFNHMLNLLPPVGGVCLQGEDEIASIGYCIGASMAGKKALTATSGPGISLCSEQISLAIATETPLVVVDVQRLGPSTGSATRGADSDIMFLNWGSTGGVPMVVLAPENALDCYLLAIHAFNFTEQLRCPVLIASNKEVGMTRESFDLNNAPLPQAIERRSFTGGTYLPFSAADDSPPAFLPVGGDTLVRLTSSTHGPDGFITNDPETIARSQQRLRRKVLSAVERLTLYEADIEQDADTLILTYGVTTRAARDAVHLIRSSGGRVSLLTLKTLWPVPEKLLCDTAAFHRRVLVVEMNLGQYVREAERLLGRDKVQFLGQMNGQLISPKTIVEALPHG